MMDASTKEEIKQAIVFELELHRHMSLEALVLKFERPVSRGAFDQVRTLLAELQAEEKVRVIRYRSSSRSGPGPVRMIFFPASSILNVNLTRSEMAEQVIYRPTNFDKLPPETQYAIDKALGILDL